MPKARTERGDVGEKSVKAPKLVRGVGVEDDRKRKQTLLQADTPSKSAEKKPVAKKVVKKRAQKEGVTKSKKVTHLTVSDADPQESAIPISVTGNSHRLSGFSIRSVYMRAIPRNPTHITTTARYAGIFFVVIGALFTLLNLSYVYGGTSLWYGQVAQLLTTDGTTITTTTSGTTDPGATSGCTIASCTSGSTSVNQEPQPSFTISPSGTLSSLASYTITVPYATKVMVMIKNKELNQYYDLGAATKETAEVWRMPWNTVNYPDGTYTVRVAITNEYTTYYVNDPNTYTVENTPISSANGTGTTANTSTATTTSTSGTTDATTIPTTSITASQFTFTTSPQTPLSGTVALQTTGSSIAEVKYYVEATGGSKTLLGYGTYYGNNLWKFNWNSTRNPDGTYTLIGLIRPTSGETVQKFITGVTVSNTATSVSTATTGTTSPTTQTTQLEPTGVVNTTTSSSTVTTTSLIPPITLSVPEGSTVTDNTDVIVVVDGARFVEVYAVPSTSLTRMFLGLARQTNNREWIFSWNTKQTPNGGYKIFAAVGHVYGVSESNRVAVSVKNVLEVATTAEQESYIQKLEETGTAVADTELPTMPTFDAEKIVLDDRDQESETISDNTTLSTGTSTANTGSGESSYVDTTTELNYPEAPVVEISQNSEMDVTAIISDFENEVAELMREYVRALRAQDQKEIEKVKKEIEALKAKIHEDVPQLDGEIEDRIKSYFNDFVKVSESRVIRQEEIIAERLGSSVLRDTDLDGISDYDEINVYSTNPYVADTDSDGAIDGTEVVGGYNPTDSKAEALMVYESPKESAIIREDVLEVQTIHTISDETDARTQALITGKGLPNSFVTLYIFSTPVVVTVKTSPDGSWSYIFDKELEDGSHEIFVGMTDNAGRIVARSKPFEFVKTAEAFTPVEARAETGFQTVSEEPSLITGRLLLVVASIAVVALGLILILLGVYSERTRRVESAVA